jgi:ribonuclease VapC
MTLDSSAIVAVICREPGYEELLRKMATSRVVVIGAPTVAECQLVLSIKLGRGSGADAGAIVDQFLGEVQALIVPFGRDHISSFYGAFHRFGKGRHPARLNMGDCFTYATAKVAGMPLLFTGGDFALTDLKCA